MAAAEKALWKALVRINLGSDALQELSSFLAIFANLEEEYAGQDPRIDWFSPEGEEFSSIVTSGIHGLLR